MNSDSIDWLKKFMEAGGDDAPAPGPLRRVGKYDVVSEIGRGGTSVVYKAIDPDLKRPVALKVLRDAQGHPALIERLHREATAAATLKHPNIVSIHEVGTILNHDRDALHFIAMDYVDGKNLAEAAAQMSPRERLEILLTVARTVAFAHERGVVHRDLKPENILVEAATRVEPSGLRWHVWLTDFGLAKIIGGEDLTRSGVVLGTPHYMSPEQVRGRSREMGPATDVWALGVMLYEILTARRPFDGETALEIYDHIVREEPASPRKGSTRVSADLDTVTLKALDKNPAARYPDARALAEDLERCLRDEPISTRPAGLVRKSWRKLRKNPLPYGLGAGMAAVILVAVGFGLVGRAERRETLQAFRHTARTVLEAALTLRRAGLNAKMREYLPPMEEAYRQASSRAPELAELDYLMGRMHRALMQDDKALAYQEAALRKDPGYAAALYERAVLTFKKYVEEVERAPDGNGTGGQDGEGWKPELAACLESMARDCSNLLAGPHHGLDAARLFVARGMLAYGRGQFADAHSLLEEAARADPLLDEVWQALGRTVRLGTAPGFEERDRRYRTEEASYTQGLLRDQGYVPYLLRRGFIRIARGHFYAEHGRDPAADFRDGEKDLTEALEKEPASFDARLRRASGRMFRGVYSCPPGSDPLEAFQLAEADLLELTPRPYDPLTPDAWRTLGAVRQYRSRYLLSRAEDPLPGFASARAAFERSLAVSKKDQDLAGGHVQLGQLLADWATHLWRTHRDPSALFKQMEDHFARGIALHPDSDWYYRLRATGLISMAEHRETRSEDPFADYARAEDDLGRAIRLRKDLTSAWKERARLRFGRGTAWEKRGEKERARQDYSAAANDYLQTFSLNPLLEPELGARMAEAKKKASEVAE
jgi:tetratricopeptide (TPR) repeat protein/predicted Ser/Thr protein kinase